MVLAAVLPKTLRDRLNLHRKAPGMLGSGGFWNKGLPGLAFRVWGFSVGAWFRI